MQQVFKLIGQVAGTRRHGADHRRKRHRQGTRRARDLSSQQSQRHSRSSPSIAPPFPSNFWKANCSATKAARSPARRVQRIGKFEQCNGGTIFLDEIGDMTPPTQTKILRVLQSGTFERVGGNQADQSRCAHHRRHQQAARSKPSPRRQFREDLFYRLNVVRIQIPPLRERREDIPLLVNYFLKKFARDQERQPKSIATSVIKTLEKYHWPGNVRELENVIRRAHVVAKGDAILLGDLPPEISGQAPARRPPRFPGVASDAATTDAATLARQLFQWAKRDPKLKIIPAVERELVIQALKETNDNQVHAAKLLGITRATLRKRIEKFGIQRELNVK